MSGRCGQLELTERGLGAKCGQFGPAEKGVDFYLCKCYSRTRNVIIACSEQKMLRFYLQLFPQYLRVSGFISSVVMCITFDSHWTVFVAALLQGVYTCLPQPQFL